jgi:hypothetical protein
MKSSSESDSKDDWSRLESPGTIPSNRDVIYKQK